nr:dihydropteroate synthase [Deltaproteobacteria bacterium]
MLLDELRGFFAERLATFARVGIGPERLVFDPGMGFFLGRSAAPSLSVLKHLASLEQFGVPLLVSVSRKSLVGEVTGRAVDRRGPGTPRCRTVGRSARCQLDPHPRPGAFRDAWAVETAIGAAE